MKKYVKIIFLITLMFLFKSNVFAISDSSKVADYCVTYNQISDKGMAKNSCISGARKQACVWNEEYQFCNVDTLVFVGCGGATDIPVQVPQFVSFAVNLLKILTPIILIVVGIITLVKAIVASEEDEIKKAQSSLIKKLIASALVFFVVTIVQFVILKIADDGDAEGIDSCMNCFLNNNCDATAYYKTNIGGRDYCTNIGSSISFDCDTGTQMDLGEHVSSGGTVFDGTGGEF